MGTPQMRWREMHQSGRVAIMLEMRSSPHAGSHFTRLISSSARWRKVTVRPVRTRDRRLHGDEPLLCGAEDDRIVAAPAMRVGVIDVVARQQCAASFEQLDDFRIGLEDLEAVVFRQSVLDAAGGVYFGGLVEAVAFAGVEVVHAVSRARVDGAGALIGSDVVGQHAEDGAVEKWMLEGGALELRARRRGDLLRRFEMAGLLDSVG